MKKTKGPPAPRLLPFAIAIALGIGLLVVHQLMDSRDAIWRRAEEANRNLLFTVNYLLERTLSSSDRAIVHTVDELSRTPADSDPSAAAGTPLPVSTQLGVGVQVILDREGQVIQSSEPLSAENWLFPDRDFFLVHRQDPDSGLFVSRPFLSLHDSQSSIALSRRWTREDGSFGGVVVQTLKLNELRLLFSSIELGPESGINLMLTDGTILMRFPYNGADTGKSLAGTANFRRFIREKHGSFTGVAALDGVERLYTFGTVSTYPLLVNTAQSTKSILAVWRRNAVWLGIATLALMIAYTALALFAQRELRAHRRTARRLQQAEHDTRTVLNSLPVLVAYWDNSLKSRFCNLAHHEWFGMSPEQSRGHHISEIIGEALFERVRPHVELALAGQTQIFEKTFPDALGLPRHTISTYIPNIDDEGVNGFFVLVTDITQRKAAEDRLSEEKERFRVTLHAIRDAVITTDDKGCVTYQNPAASAMTGWQDGEAVGKPIEEIVRIEDRHDPEAAVPNPVRLALQRRVVVRSHGEHVLRARNGALVHVEDSAAPIFDEHDSLVGIVLVFHEVGDARLLAEHMTRLALHDPLTGLPNPRFLNQLADRAMARVRRNGRRAALLFLDLDGFKTINDTCGHDVGDQLLIAVTERLSQVLRQGDSLSRKGGDEFIVLMDGIADLDEPRALAQRLIERCAEPFPLAGQPLTVTVSIGIAIFPDDADNFEGLLRCADKAMYSAKLAGRNRYSEFQEASAGA